MWQCPSTVTLCGLILYLLKGNSNWGTDICLTDNTHGNNLSGIYCVHSYWEHWQFSFTWWHNKILQLVQNALNIQNVVIQWYSLFLWLIDFSGEGWIYLSDTYLHMFSSQCWQIWINYRQCADICLPNRTIYICFEVSINPCNLLSKLLFISSWIGAFPMTFPMTNKCLVFCSMACHWKETMTRLCILWWL